MSRPMFMTGASQNDTYAIFKDLATGEKSYHARLANGYIDPTPCKTARMAETLRAELIAQRDEELARQIAHWQ